MTTSTACQDTSCTGHIEDGYCNVCGAPAGHTLTVAPEPVATSTAQVVSQKLGSIPLGSAVTGATTVRTSSGRTRAAAPRLGVGLTTVPAAPITQARSAVLANPEVAEEKRNCASCQSPVGRSKGGKPGRPKGFCPKCGTAFDFSPRLQPGDIVAGQYEVVGCLAHGGLGWIYLAVDKNVSDRYVVLKGLVNSGDADALAVAVAERQFLAEVEHPLIVEIYNFVAHNGHNYIVMEYVGGRSVKQVLKARMVANNGVYAPIPVDQALAYIIEILPAFSYLHTQGLIYCDFKPDNMIQVGDGLKLIDLGGVRRADDTTSAIYGTVGYQAPEVPSVGPSIAGDIYTIGRALAVMTFEFRGNQTTYVDSLPPAGDVGVFARYDSFYRVIAKACATNPADRFQSADEFREQLIGVLRDVVAQDRSDAAGGLTIAAHSAPSNVFAPVAAASSTLTWDDLPALLPDRSDPAAVWLAGLTVTQPDARLQALDTAPDQTIEVQLARAAALTELAVANQLGGRNVGQAGVQLTGLLTDIITADPWEWRALYLHGVAALAGVLDGDDAVALFNTVCNQVPGEPGARFALAVACDRAGRRDEAAGLYSACARVDANIAAPALLRLAEFAADSGRLTAALAYLDQIPATSGLFVVGRRRRAEMLAADDTNLASLDAAVDTISATTIDAEARAQLLIRIYTSALQRVAVGGAMGVATKQQRIGAVPCTEHDLQVALESTYRELAAMTSDRDRRIRYVDMANRVRPRTLV
jgi:serine/threonine-protein kinase PknG